MTREVNELMARREETIVEQGDLYSQVLANSIDPGLAASLLSRVSGNAVRQHQLTKAIDAAIDKSRHSLWHNLFGFTSR